LTKTGYAAVLVTVIGIHWYLLHYRVPVKKVVAKPDAKIYHITLSRVSVKKPPPQIPPAPEIEPVTPPSPTIKPPKPLPKKHVIKKPPVKKRPLKKRIKKKILKQKVVKKESPKPTKRVPAPAPIVKEKVVRQHATVSEQSTATILDRYIALIRKRIASHLYYPRIAKRMRMQGEVEVAFVVDADGGVNGIRVIRAPKKILANAAIKTLQSLDLPPIPAALHRQRLQLSIPIEFKLHKGAS
jgi:protein TonB